jgi:GMP synthase-like glutamine amidotransferase
MDADMRILVLQHIACEHPGTLRELMREDGALVHTVELDEGEPIPSLDEFDVLMVMGGPMDVWQTELHPWLRSEVAAIREWVAVKRRPYLGFCLGHQLLAAALGGAVGPAREPEIGVMSVTLTAAGRTSPFLVGIPAEIPCLQWHSAEITRAPDGAEILASSPACTVNALSWGGHAMSIQFHVEITPSTVEEWGAIPQYAMALEQSLGEDGLLRFEEDSRRKLADFQQIAKQLYTNFMAIARASAS